MGLYGLTDEVINKKHMIQRISTEESEVSRQARLPVQTDGASLVIPFTESLTLVMGETNDPDTAGVAGDIVYVRLTKGGCLDSMGDRLATPNDTSLEVSAAPFSVYVPFDWETWSGMQAATRWEKLQKLTEGFANGEYTFIPDSGIVVGKKDSVDTTGTFSYLVREPSLSARSVDEDGDTAVAGVAPAGTMQAVGGDATGADTYATILTAAADATHMLLSLGGSNDAIISLDNGVTDHMVLPAGSVIVLDSLDIPDTTVIQAKNRTPGSNYSSLAVSIW